jgi:hypothetical protein
MPASQDAPRTPADRAVWLARVLCSALIAVLLVVAGCWSSWDTVQHSLYAKEDQRGVLTLADCDRSACTGAFAPRSTVGDAVAEVRLTQRIGLEQGDELTVALWPDSTDAIRTGLAGFLYGWLPLSGSLLLASLLIAGGMRLYRVGWAVGGLALALLGATFFAW